MSRGRFLFLLGTATYVIPSANWSSLYPRNNQAKCAFLWQNYQCAMPVTYSINGEALLIRTKCSGNLTLQEVIDHFRTLRDDPACPSYLNVLLDCAEIVNLPNSRQLEAVGYEIRNLREKVRFGFCAVIAPRDALFGMLQVFAVVAQDYFREIRVFRSLEEGEYWLHARHAAV